MFVPLHINILYIPNYMRKLLLFTVAIMMCGIAMAYDDVTVTKSGLSSTLRNGLVRLTIGTNGRVSAMYLNGGSTSLLASSGVYFDYTTSSGNTSLSPSTLKIVQNTDSLCEVLYSNTSADLQFQQGYIMRKGESGFYTYVIVNGTSSSADLDLKEARVCTRLASTFLNGYVDDTMNGTIPSNSEMSTAESNQIQDATYYLSDGVTVYTKYDWANYCVKDSLHGLMNDTCGVWNIPCSYEWMNGGPMKQELTVHATSKSPITIQMIQGEHLGANAMYFDDGEQKIYGPFFIYLNTGSSTEEMIADAKAMAHQKMEEWPFTWFENDLYPTDRSTVTGKINVLTGECDSIQVVLAEPGEDPFLQGKSYMFWATTDKEGNFTIKNVRKGDYSLYAWALSGVVTDMLEYEDVTIEDDEQELGDIYWSPTTYENLVWNIGENNRLSDGFRYSDTLRSYGLWNLVPEDLDFYIGESDEATDWYYAQTQNGTWTIYFDLDEVPTTVSHLTASAAGATNKPTITVKVNGSSLGTWSFSTNDASIYRSAVLGGRHWLQTKSITAARLKTGQNKITLTQSGISSNGGVMWDCIKFETGNLVESGIAEVEIDANILDDGKIDVYTISGMKIGTFDSINDANLSKGIYIFKSGKKSGKFVK